ncbi:hypothetical protein [Flavobacterium sp. GT3R68]|uniref:hypothetical protein n=1 Tax=Flavobacterium sp. GT3R68 TaxID=2594437 RepID=UPI000F8678B0|nr:hypothetical protein [Flavobacterium sp. GT3R68]RTY85480.1 hypothetical protein EKL32_28545 [Flavobacterium sp. GSN2]TRW88714.1 hypothetical protein FNW07_13615 [Flavobacterium sp. GT3R68]
MMNKQIFRIDSKKYEKKKSEQHKLWLFLFIFISIITIVVNYKLYRLINKDLSFFVISAISSIVIFFIILKKTFKISSVQWDSYQIELSEIGVKRTMRKPIIREFQSDTWETFETRIKWENLVLSQSTKFILTDKSISEYNRNIKNEGIIIIPEEIERREELISKIKTSANSGLPQWLNSVFL